jgi:hypothetical protein
MGVKREVLKKAIDTKTKEIRIPRLVQDDDSDFQGDLGELFSYLDELQNDQEIG